MALSVRAYIVLLFLVAFLRLAEVGISRRNQRRLAARGVEKVREPGFRWMVAFHACLLVAAGAEVVLLRRPLIPALAIGMGLVFAAANGVRWWVMRTLAEHWNVQVMASARLGVVMNGPYRWVRHPNYAAVFLELIALPLVHAAWMTAAVGAVVHAAILRQRMRVEESVLLADAQYRAAMASKPRFVPRLFRGGAKPSRRG